MQNEEGDWAICALTSFLHSPICLLPFHLELKPQQTGTGLLIRYGEVATTSGSTNPASWCNSSMPGFDPDGLGANPSEAASSTSSICARWIQVRKIMAGRVRRKTQA